MESYLRRSNTLSLFGCLLLRVKSYLRRSNTLCWRTALFSCHLLRVKRYQCESKPLSWRTALFGCPGLHLDLTSISRSHFAQLQSQDAQRRGDNWQKNVRLSWQSWRLDVTEQYWHLGCEPWSLVQINQSFGGSCCLSVKIREVYFECVGSRFLLKFRKFLPNRLTWRHSHGSYFEYLYFTDRPDG
jgi:hypothetical protein